MQAARLAVRGCARATAPRRGAAAAAAVAASGRAAAVRTQHVVLSVAGLDRVGIVNDFTRTALAHDANVEETRMARLGGDFCIIGMLSLTPSTDAASLANAFEKTFPDFHVHCRHTRPGADEDAAGPGKQDWVLELEGPDSTGIVAAVTEELAKSAANIHDMDTETTQAPFAGFTLFKLGASFSCDSAQIDNILKAMTVVENKFGVSIVMSKKASNGAKDDPSAA